MHWKKGWLHIGLWWKHSIWKPSLYGSYQIHQDLLFYQSWFSGTPCVCIWFQDEKCFAWFSHGVWDDRSTRADWSSFSEPVGERVLGTACILMADSFFEMIYRKTIQIAIYFNYCFDDSYQVNSGLDKHIPYVSDYLSISGIQSFCNISMASSMDKIMREIPAYSDIKWSCMNYSDLTCRIP